MLDARLRRVALSATLLLTLIVPAVASFVGPQDQIDNNNHKLESLQGRIDQNASVRNSLQTEIDELNKDITRFQIAINKLDTKIAEVRSEIRTAQAQIDATQEEIYAVEEQATEQAVELYKSGGVETLDALLNASSISELNDRLEMMGVAAENSTGALIEYSRLKAEIEEANRELFAKQDELDARLEEQTKAQNQLAETKAELDTKLASVTEKLVQDKSHEAGLLAENAKLQQQILQNQAPPGVDMDHRRPPVSSGP